MSGQLNTMAGIEEAGKLAGNAYTEGIEGVRDSLETPNAGETTLGKMVGASLDLTNEETKYQVKSGVPKKAAAELKIVGSAINQASR